MLQARGSKADVETPSSPIQFALQFNIEAMENETSSTTTANRSWKKGKKGHMKNCNMLRVRWCKMRQVDLAQTKFVNESPFIPLHLFLNG